MGMMWSQIKKQLEDRVCDSLKGRIRFHMTKYRSHLGHEPETRLWITADGEEFLSVSKLEWLTNWDRISNEIRKINNCTNFRDPAQSRGYSRAYDDAERVLSKCGLFNADEFLASLQAYLSLPVCDALASENPVFLALAIIDRRVGKRRLGELDIPKYAHPLVHRMLELRLGAEGMTS